jgi:hypothetical protein
MFVSRCKFWSLDWEMGCKVQRSASIDQAEWTRRAGFAMTAWIKRATLPPAAGITEKVEQLQ